MESWNFYNTHALVESIYDNLSVLALGTEQSMIKKGVQIMESLDYPEHLVKMFEDDKEYIAQDGPGAYVIAVVSLERTQSIGKELD